MEHSHIFKNNSFMGARLKWAKFSPQLRAIKKKISFVTLRLPRTRTNCLQLFSLIPAQIVCRYMSSSDQVAGQSSSATAILDDKHNFSAGDKKAVTGAETKAAAEQLDEFTDPFCNADNPQIITFQDVTSAAFKIKNGIEYTPCPVS